MKNKRVIEIFKNGSNQHQNKFSTTVIVPKNEIKNFQNNLKAEETTITSVLIEENPQKIVAVPEQTIKSSEIIEHKTAKTVNFWTKACVKRRFCPYCRLGYYQCPVNIESKCDLGIICVYT